MSLDLVGLPCEIRFKIFDHVSVADLTKWLKIQKLRDSILAFLEDEGKFFILKKVYGPWPHFWSLLLHCPWTFFWGGWRTTADWIGSKADVGKKNHKKAFKARRSAKYFPLRNKIRKLDYSLLDNPQDGIERQMPHLR